MKLIDKPALVAEIDKRLHQLTDAAFDSMIGRNLIEIRDFIDTLEVKEMDVSNISENLAEAYEYLDYTSTGNLAHNKPIVSARLEKAIRSLFDAGLFELTHDKKYRMEQLGLKAQKGE